MTRLALGFRGHRILKIENKAVRRQFARFLQRARIRSGHVKHATTRTDGHRSVPCIPLLKLAVLHDTCHWLAWLRTSKTANLSTRKRREGKMLKTTICTAVFALAMTIIVPLAARAADPAFCAGYADASINQVRGALSNQNCARGAVGSRWSPERHVHFDWCLSQPPGAVAAERQARTDFLRGCRG